MKTILTSAFSFLLIFALYAQGEIISTTFTSPSFDGESFNLNVYLPEGYDENSEPYPLYIFLHGCCGLNHNTHVADFEDRLNTLIEEERIAPLVVAFPSAQGSLYGNRHVWFNSELNGPYSDLITEDLLNWLEDNYNLSGEKRAVGGFSMGADGAIRMGLRRADLFLASISHSGFPALDFVTNLIPGLIAETGQSAPPYEFSPSNGVFSSQVFGVSTAWSPNPDNEPYGVDFPLDENGLLIDSVFWRWKLNADVDSIVQHNWEPTGEVPLSIYFDAGLSESFLGPNQLLNTQLNELSTNLGYTISYKYLEFPGGHALPTPKIDSSLLWLDSIFDAVLPSGTSEDYTISNELILRANPVVGNQLHFEITNCHACCLRSVQLTDQLGRILSTIPVKDLTMQTDSSYTLNVSSLKNGVYFLLVETQTEVIVQQFIRY